MIQLPTTKHTDELTIAGTTIGMAERSALELPLGQLPTQTKVAMRVEVVRGQGPGPVVWLSSSIHGDEINGVEIVRQVLRKLKPGNLTGTVIAVPIVNVFGFDQESRYLPDRRDLNRSFPGSPRGSMASRLANFFMTEVVQKCDLGIDLHTASKGRYNLPQVRGSLADTIVSECAQAFSAPVFIESTPPKGSLRKAANSAGIPVVLYEGGEAGRFDLDAIDLGIDGTLRVLKALGMVKRAPSVPDHEVLEIPKTKWVRARRAGLLRLKFTTGDFVKKKQKIGVIGDALGDRVSRVSSPCDGIIISHATTPLLNQGDPIVHIASWSAE